MDLKDFLQEKSSFDLNKLVDAAKEVSEGSSNKVDERFWRPTVDKAGNGYAVIRFLPSPDTELPWTRYWSHGFKGPTGKWYIENSLTSIGQDDPVSEMNSKLWNEGTEDDKAIVRERKRRLHYVANIIVVSDPSEPDNNGKVFLYSFGKKIFDKIQDAMQPEFPDEKPINPFDLMEGADFQLKIRKVEGYRNYDKSEFKSASKLFDGDTSALQTTIDGLMTLAEFTAPESFKSYDELKTKLLQVIGEKPQPKAAPTHVTSEAEDTPEAPEPEQKEATNVEEIVNGEESEEVSGEDDPMSYFKKLAAGEV
jgi:hypothetical protein